MSSQAAFRGSASISSFEGLPTELLLIIRNFIGYGCLADHICFAFTCTRFKALYPSDKWQDLLRLGGHGKPLDIDWLQRHHLPAHNIWEDLAIAIARHTRSCKFDPCNSYFSDFETPYYEPEVHSGKDYRIFSAAEVEAGRIGCQVFGVSAELETDYFPVHVIATLFDIWSRDQVTLWDHAEAACAFATIPPVTEMKIMVLNKLEISVVNPDGVTILDCISQLHEDLVVWEIDLEDLRDVYAEYSGAFYRMDQFDFLRDMLVKDVIQFLLAWCREATKDPSNIGFVQEILRICEEIPQTWWNDSVLDVPLPHLGGDAPPIQLQTINEIVEWTERLGPSVTSMEWWKTLDNNRLWNDVLSGCWLSGLRQIAPGSTTFSARWQDGDYELV